MGPIGSKSVRHGCLVIATIPGQVSIDPLTRGQIFDPDDDFIFKGFGTEPGSHTAMVIKKPGSPIRDDDLRAIIQIVNEHAAFTALEVPWSHFNGIPIRIALIHDSHLLGFSQQQKKAYDDPDENENKENGFEGFHVLPPDKSRR